MGGFGSTRWNGHSKKWTVEECLTLDINYLTREGILLDGKEGYSYTMRYFRHNVEYASIGYTVGERVIPNYEPFKTISPNYQLNGESIPPYEIVLYPTKPHFGGKRYWFLCPLTHGGKPCMRKVSKLYLPTGARHFGCRHCYDLTYESAQEAHQFDSFLRSGAKIEASILKDYLDDIAFAREFDRKLELSKRRRAKYQRTKQKNTPG